MESVALTPTTDVSPARILETGMGFFATKTLLAAIKLNLFTELDGHSLPAEEVITRLALHRRSALDFLDALVSLGFLRREGNDRSARYANTRETYAFLRKNSPDYIGGILEMANDRLYPFWGTLEEALHTGRPQNEVKSSGRPFFEALYADPARLQQFLEAMAGLQLANFRALSEVFDFSPYRTLCDIGGANGMLSITLAGKHPHLRCQSLDLPEVEPIARQTIEKHGLTDRVRTGRLNFMDQDFPTADLITMGNILHDWDLPQKRMLIDKAYRALSPDGALIVIENIIDDERRANAFGLMMSLNMLIETEGGFDYSHEDFHNWATEAGFRTTAKVPLTGPASAVIAFK
ncbi:methyltransferase [Larkinella soli]|uniref:methyltransferase n=1 Tax=Larkinella soli TaxID=1770527 RepID=UPI000FFC73A4|nr:methyltransferase [Larkinella soli]